MGYTVECARSLSWFHAQTHAFPTIRACTANTMAGTYKNHLEKGREKNHDLVRASVGTDEPVQVRSFAAPA